MSLYNQLKNVNGKKLTISTIERSTSIPIIFKSGDYLVDTHKRYTSKYESYIYKGWGLKTLRKPALVVLYCKNDPDDSKSIDGFHDLVQQVLKQDQSKELNQDEIEDSFETLGLSTYSINLRQLFYGFRKLHFIAISERMS